MFRNSWWTYRRDHFEIPDSYTGEYHYVHTNGSSMVIPVTDEGKIILVNQFRYLCGQESIEFPCGSVKEGNNHIETAYLELQEETGFKAETLEFVGEFNPYNGVTNEMCRIFIATSLRQATARPDETEELEILFCTPDEIDFMISENRIWDGMTLAAWMIAHKKFGSSPV